MNQPGSGGTLQEDAAHRGRALSFELDKLLGSATPPIHKQRQRSTEHHAPSLQGQSEAAADAPGQLGALSPRTQAPTAETSTAVEDRAKGSQVSSGGTSKHTGALHQRVQQLEEENQSLNTKSWMLQKLLDAHYQAAASPKTEQGSSQPAADPPPQAETLPAGRQEGRRDRVQPDSPPEVQQLPEALRALYTTHVQELSKLSASADASSQQYFMSYKALVAKLHLLLDAASKRHLRQHVMVCIKALFAVQQEVLRVWSSGSPAQPGLLAMEIRCHNAQFPQVDVIQAHHTALAQLRISRNQLDNLAAMGQEYWQLAGKIHKERLAVVHGLQQAFLQQERHPGMDLIGATLKYEMDLRDLRAAENLSQSKLLFFFGPQGFDPLQNAKLQTSMLPMLLDVALLSHVICAMARKPMPGPLAAPSLSLPAQPPPALADLGDILGHASAPQSLGKLGRRIGLDSPSFAALPPAKRVSSCGALPPLAQQLPPAPWVQPGSSHALQPCNSSLCSSETRLPLAAAFAPAPPRRTEIDLDLIRSRAGPLAGPNAFDWPGTEPPRQAPPLAASALPENWSRAGLLDPEAGPRQAQAAAPAHTEALWPDAMGLDQMQGPLGGSLGGSLGLDEFAEWLDIPGSLQSLQDLCMPASSLEQRHQLRQQQQQNEQMQEGAGQPWYLGPNDTAPGSKLASLFPPVL